MTKEEYRQALWNLDYWIQIYDNRADKRMGESRVLQDEAKDARLRANQIRKRRELLIEDFEGDENE